MQKISLQETLYQVRARVGRYGDAGVNEQNTKAALIDPVLRALGWDLEDIDEVHREFKPMRADKPVDYALLILGRPRLFIEAKALGENLADRRWANQVMGYAVVAGVEWVVLTNGDEYRIYNAHAAVPVEDKIFRVVRIADEDALVEETLELLSKDQLQMKQIEALWNAHYVDRQIRSVIEKLFGPDPDPSIVNLLKKRLPALSPLDIRAGLGRLRIRLDVLPEPDLPVEPVSQPSVPETSVESAAVRENVSLRDLIEVGLIKPPTNLFKTYKGHSLTAVIEADGRVVCEGQTHGSLSAAAGTARHSIVGAPPGRKYPQTNGWTFWKVQTDEGVEVIDTLRERYIKDSVTLAS